MSKSDFEFEQMLHVDSQQHTAAKRRVTTPNTAPAGLVTTPNAAPAGLVTTPNAAPAGRVTTPNAAPAGRVTTPNAAPAGRVTTPNVAPAGRVTTPNTAPAGRVTTPNAAPAGRVTTPNAVPAGRVTMPNAALTPQPDDYAQVISISSLPEGTFVTSEIMITERLNAAMQGGESVMYKCRLGDQKEEYVFKIFQRQIDEQEYEAKMQLINALQGVNYVAPVLRHGRYGGNYYEVIPYYKKGSLAERLKKGTLSETEIRTAILPKLNRALHAVHQAGVIHADIKPSNILYANRGNDFVLIDFGISKVVDERRFVTTAGKSVDYAAPEIQLNKAAKESDYFALGITLYELFAGKTPTAEVSEKDVAFALMLQNGGRIRKKQGMSDNFYALLLQLTYQYIAPDKITEDFPVNARWGYDQVCKWLSVDQIPRHTLQRILHPTEQVTVGQSITFAYRNTICRSMNELIVAMSGSQLDTAYHYAMATQDSFSAALEVGCHSENSQMRDTMMALRKKYRAFKEKLPDRLPREDKMIMFYYTFAENLSVLFLPTLERINADSLEAMGKDILTTMLRDEKLASDKYRPLLTRRILENYLLQREQSDMQPAEHRILSKMEELMGIVRRDENWKIAVYALGYTLAGNQPFQTDGFSFSSIKQLTERLAKEENTPPNLVQLIGRLVKNSKQLDDRFAGWLISQNVPYKSMTL